MEKIGESGEHEAIRNCEAEGLWRKEKQRILKFIG